MTEYKCVFVTGSEGALGHHVVDCLYQEYPNIKVIRTGRKEHFLLDGRSRYYWGDLCDVSFCNKIFRENKVDCVISCAALWNGINQDDYILSNNMNLLSSVLHTMGASIKKFVYISSSAVYDQQASNLEGATLTSQTSTYGSSKLFGETLVKSLADSLGYSYTIYRPFHLVSPYENYCKGRSHVCTDFCYRIIEQGEKIDMHSLLDSPYIGFTWAADAGKIISSNIGSSKLHNVTVNLGTNEENNLYQLAELIYKKATSTGLIESYSHNRYNIESRLQKDGRYDKMQKLCCFKDMTSLPSIVDQYVSIKYIEGMNSEI